MTHKERRKRRERVVKQLRTGQALGDIAADTGLSPSSLYKICSVYGLRPARNRLPPRVATPTDRVLRIIADLLNRKEPLRVTGQRHQITHQAIDSIRQRAIAAGIPIKKRKVTP